MPAKKTKTLRPRDARTFAQQLRLQRDSKDVPAGWILVDCDRVCLRNQIEGEGSTGRVEFTHAEFCRLIDWYNRPQKLRKEKP